MRLFVSGLIEQCNRFKFPVELILVEWNPPPDSPLLQDILPKPIAGDYLSLRYIIVPSRIHNRYRRAPDVPLFQMTAKNVGIRRARGEFVLCTNVDVLFSEELFCVLTEKKFQKDTFYRANRCDVPDGVEESWKLEEQLRWCSKNIIKRLGRDMRFRNASLEQFGLSESSWIRKWLFDKLIVAMTVFWPPEKREYYKVDSYACGDFTLMAKEAWLDMKGYLEVDLYSVHIDTLGLLFAKAMGYKQHVFPRKICLYHIFHEMGWESMSPIKKLEFQVERPGIDYSYIFSAGIYALKHKKPCNPNPDDWGFEKENFQEYVFPK